MNTDEITYGVEIECKIPSANCPELGGYHCGRQIPGLPEGWNAQSDGSLSNGSGTRGVEIVSPVLKGADGLRQIKVVTDWLKTVGAKVDRECGFHVHVGVALNDETKKRLSTVVANFEKAIFAATGTKQREQGNFCRSVQRDANYRKGRFSYVDRYHVLNIRTNKPTVEFRAFAGTTNHLKIVSYVRLCVGIVERGLGVKRLPGWEAKTPTETSPIKRDGDGQTALARLMYWLGWTKGRTPVAYGYVGGLENEGPTLKQCKAELADLAAKYDAPPVDRTAAQRFPVGTQVRVEREGHWSHGRAGVVHQRTRGRSPIIRDEVGRLIRVQLANLRTVGGPVAAETTATDSPVVA